MCKYRADKFADETAELTGATGTPGRPTNQDIAMAPQVALLVCRTRFPDRSRENPTHPDPPGSFSERLPPPCRTSPDPHPPGPTRTPPGHGVYQTLRM